MGTYCGFDDGSDGSNSNSWLNGNYARGITKRRGSGNVLIAIVPLSLSPRSPPNIPLPTSLSSQSAPSIPLSTVLIFPQPHIPFPTVITSNLSHKKINRHDLQYTHTHTHTHVHTHTRTQIDTHTHTHTHAPVSYTHLTLPTIVGV